MVKFFTTSSSFITAIVKKLCRAKLFVIILLAAMMLPNAPVWAADLSDGWYRIPYANGTEIKVTNDHKTHNPLIRIDMHGVEGNTPYRIVAAADGTIRFIVDSNSKRQDDPPCDNNYVWIEHSNREWTKYSHMRKDSVTKDAGLKVGDFVKAGRFLGYESDVGCASGSHLHFEVGVPNPSDPIIPQGGFLKDNANSKRNRIPRICKVPGGVFVDGETYVATDLPNVSPGFAEVARHGVPSSDYQCVFDQITKSGYRLDWIDGFNFNGNIYFNVIFRSADGVKWASFHNLTASQYQDKFNEYTNAGYRPTQVESYPSGNKILYAVIFAKDNGPNFTAYHGLSAEEHQKRFDDLIKDGWRPKNISVVSINGNRSYTALYEKTNIGSFVAKSFLTAADYQKQFDENKEQVRQIAYLNAYEHNGEPRFTAIWNSVTNGTFKARHGLSSNQYQNEWEEALKNGLLTRNVTGYVDGNSVKYAAVWRK
jgi:hypothetical protein